MMKKILSLNSEIDALRIKDILDSHEIPHVIRTYSDTAYDGLFQNQYGWGVLEADVAFESRILELTQDFNG